MHAEPTLWQNVDRAVQLAQGAGLQFPGLPIQGLRVLAAAERAGTLPEEPEPELPEQPEVGLRVHHWTEACNKAQSRPWRWPVWGLRLGCLS